VAATTGAKDETDDGPLAPSLLGAALPPPGPVQVAFFSGGKDSFLAVCAAAADGDAPPLLLLTTHDAATRTVAHQEVPLDVVARQAAALRLPLVAVPLPSGGAGGGTTYGDRIRAVVRWLAAPPRGLAVGALVFGDLHLAHIRAWREAEFAGVALRFPLWRVPYAELGRRLVAAGHPVRLTAVEDEACVAAGVAVGDVFDAALVARLPPGVDAWGENGEFHTVVACWEGGAAADV